MSAVAVEANEAGGAPSERGWGKLLLALAAFLLLPAIPQLRALLPIERTTVLFVPALAACCLVGWWAGGRVLLALLWVALATILTVQTTNLPDAFSNMARGWSLLVAGAFGLVCLFGDRRHFLPRGLVALTLALILALIMSVLGPVNGALAQKTVAGELARRNLETMHTLNGFIGDHPEQWQELTTKVPELSEFPATTERALKSISNAGLSAFPALLALESLAGLALAWATYHRLSRTRLGPPLAPLRAFRFNDQLVWGLIVGLTVMFLPTLAAFRGVGRNLLVFFGALYALRGLGVLAWFLAPRAFLTIIAVVFAVLWLPILGAIGVMAFGLGLGDTWADWRNRVRPNV